MSFDSPTQSKWGDWKKALTQSSGISVRNLSISSFMACSSKNVGEGEIMKSLSKNLLTNNSYWSPINIWLSQVKILLEGLFQFLFSIFWFLFWPLTLLLSSIKNSIQESYWVQPSDTYAMVIWKAKLQL